MTRNILLLISILLLLTVPASAIAFQDDRNVPSETIAYQLEFNILSPEGKPVSNAHLTVLEKDSGRVVSQFDLQQGKAMLDLSEEKTKILSQGRQMAAQHQAEYTGITDVNYIAFVTTEDSFGVSNFPIFYVHEKDYSLYSDMKLEDVREGINTILASSTKSVSLQLNKITKKHLKEKNNNFKPNLVDFYWPRKYSEEWIGSYCVWIDNVYNVRSGNVGVEYYYQSGRKHKIEVGSNASGKWASGGGYVSVTNKRSNASKWSKASNGIGTTAGFTAGSNYSFYHEYWMIPRPVGVPIYYEQICAHRYDGGTFRKFYSYVSSMEKPYKEVRNQKHGQWSVFYPGDEASFHAESGLEISGAVKIYGTYLKSQSVYHSKSCHIYYPYGDGTSSWRLYFYDRFTDWENIYSTEGRSY